MPRRFKGLLSVITRVLAAGSMLSALVTYDLLHAAFRVLDQSASAIAQRNAFVT